MSAGPFSARLLTNAPLPKWLKEPEAVKAADGESGGALRGQGGGHCETGAAVFAGQSRHPEPPS